MSDLTKEYFDQQIGKLATKKELTNVATKKELKELATKEDVIELRNFVEGEISDLARITADGFAEIKQQLDVRKKVEVLEKQMYEVREALKI